MSNVPALAFNSADRGAPESYFPLRAMGFYRRAPNDVRYNERMPGEHYDCGEATW
jgi:hypothetical protein